MHKTIIDKSNIINIAFFSAAASCGISYKDTIDPMNRSMFVDALEARLDTILEDMNPSNSIIISDCKRADIWRKDIDPLYKATRDEYVGPIKKTAFEFMDDHIKSLGWNDITVDKCECDDIIGWICRQSTDYTILSSDHDLLQCGVKQINSNRTPVTFDSYFKNQSTKFPKHRPPTKQDIVFVKSICGDVGDNVPNIKRGCGIAFAVNALLDMELLKKFLADNPESKDRLRKNITLVSFEETPKILQENIGLACNGMI